MKRRYNRSIKNFWDRVFIFNECSRILYFLYEFLVVSLNSVKLPLNFSLNIRTNIECEVLLGVGNESTKGNTVKNDFTAGSSSG